MNDGTTQYPEGTTFDVKAYIVHSNDIRSQGRKNVPTLKLAQQYKDAIERSNPGSRVDIVPCLPDDKDTDHDHD